MFVAICDLSTRATNISYDMCICLLLYICSIDRLYINSVCYISIDTDDADITTRRNNYIAFELMASLWLTGERLWAFELTPGEHNAVIWASA